MTLGAVLDARREWARQGASSICAIAIACAACAEITGIDDYSVGEAGPGPTLPARPDSHRIAVCETCVAEKCKAEREACLKTERCQKMLACQGACSDPNCIAQCADTLPSSLDFADYFVCVFDAAAPFRVQPNTSKCAQECGAGENWECVGRYRWDERVRNQDAIAWLHLQNWGAGPGALAGVEVAPCDDVTVFGPLEAGDYGCDPWQDVDGNGHCPVNFAHASDVFAIRGGAGEKHRVYPRPIIRSGLGPLDVPITSSRVLSWFIGGADPSFDPTLGVLSFRSLDCLGELGPAEIELATAGGARRIYTTNEVRPDPVGPAGAVGVFYNVPLDTVAKLTGRVGGEQKLEAVVRVASGWVTEVFLYPKPYTGP